MTVLKTELTALFTEFNVKLLTRAYALGLAMLLLGQALVQMPMADAWWLSGKKKVAEQALESRVNDALKVHATEKLKAVLPQIDNRSPYENVVKTLGLENRTTLTPTEASLVDRYLSDDARTIANVVRPVASAMPITTGTNGSSKLALKVDGIPVRMPVFSPSGSGLLPPIQPSPNVAPVVPSHSPEAMNYLIFTDPTEQNILNFINGYNKRLSYDQARTISSSISEYSRGFAVDPHLLTSVLAVESSFNPHAISTSGAIGLGQLKPATAKWLGVNDPFNPRENVYGTAKYLNFLLDKYNGSTTHAVAAYYKGQGTIDREGIDADAQYYVGKVNRMLGQIRR